MGFFWYLKDDNNHQGDTMSKSSNKPNTQNKKTPMSKTAAQRIQRAADKTGQNQSFKQRAQRAASKNNPSQTTQGKKGRR